jgi:isoleucyl-tRNA synthetase
MEGFPEVDEALLDPALEERWERILRLRADVGRALEAARQAKVIGHALDARVRLSLPHGWKEFFADDAELLRTVFIVSDVRMEEGEDWREAVEGQEVEGLRVLVEAASGEKCRRCWVKSETVGTFDDHPGVCGRCHAALQALAG